MARNRYIKLVRKIERDQIARQEKELASIRRKLRSQVAESAAVPLADEHKERRVARLEHKRRYRPERFKAAA